MIALDALRSALVSPQPWSALDRLVRAELSQGRLTKQIREELIEMEEQARGTPGFNDDAEEALHDTIDALAGICPAQYAYENPPVLPTEEELVELPRWARVAYAARCARRLLPLFQIKWPNAPSVYIETLELAVELVENTAEHHDELDANAAPKLLTTAYYVGDAIINADRDRPRAEKVIQAIPTALKVLASVEEEPFQSILPVIFQNTVTALANAVTLNSIEFETTKPQMRHILRREFDSLLNLATWLEWDDTTSVSPNVFGPLWPDGTPQRWPRDVVNTEQKAIVIGVSRLPSAFDREFSEETLNIFNALNEYHISRGGQPLTLNDLQLYLPALVPAGV